MRDAAARRRHLPDAADAVPIEDGVGAQNGVALQKRLGGDEPVKGIPMVESQARALDAVRDLDREPRDAVSRHLARKPGLPAARQFQLPEALLDGDLPGA